MPFSSAGQYVAPINFRTDAAAGIGVESERLQTLLDDIIAAMTQVRTIAANAGATLDLSPYALAADVTAALALKQTLLGYTPINATAKGAANGVAPLGSDGKVPAENLPETAVTGGVDSFNTRTGSVSLLLSDITSLIGGTASLSGHTHIIGNVTGLQTALDAKQDVIGFTPAAATHSHAIADVTSLQATLDAKMLAASTITTAGNLVWPVGHSLIAAATAGLATRTSYSVYYDGVSNYTLTATGTVMTGTWRCNGWIDAAPDYWGLMQRVA